MGEKINQKENEVPIALKRWFVLHFAVDITFAIPLMIIPELFLTFLGWTVVDPIATRIVAAALFGIGIESLLGRNGSLESFKGMLNLKIIWSFATVLGIVISMFHVLLNTVVFLVLLLAIFVVFNIVWVYWRIKLNRLEL
jgi:hypothetical protein